MGTSSKLKIAMIGGGSRIAGAVLLQLLKRDCTSLKEVVLYGRTMTNVENNIKLADIICPPVKRSFGIIGSDSLDRALDGADIIFYNATAGLESFGGYKALGIAQGAHIMYIAEKITKLCPEAWLLVNTNPPDIPLSAVKKRFQLEKVIGCCNAPVITRKVLSCYLEVAKTVVEAVALEAVKSEAAALEAVKSEAVALEAVESEAVALEAVESEAVALEAVKSEAVALEEELQLYEIGVNHDLWFYDILLREKHIYNQLRERLPKDYCCTKIQSDYLDSFPEWRKAFENNIEILQSTGYLSSPVGGSERFSGLPLGQNELAKMMKRPSREDFQQCISENADRDKIFKVTSRCGGGIPIYIADIIEAILNDSGRQCSMQVLNKGVLPGFPDDVLLQMTCRFREGNVVRPEIKNIPEYIIGTLATKILQNNLVAQALAEQDEKLMLQALLMIPERMGIKEAQKIINSANTL